MTRADRILLIILTLVCVLSVPLAAAAGAGRGVLLKGPAGCTRVDPGRDGRYTVAGRDGAVVFEVRDGVVRCVASSCPDQVCVRSGSLTPSRPIVCAPNGVVASLTSSRGGGLDAVSR